MRSIRELVRLARRLEAAYEQRRRVGGHNPQCFLEHLSEAYQDLERQLRLTGIAKARGWQVAGGQKHQHLIAALRVCEVALTQIRQEWLELPVAIPALRDLLAELQGLLADFDRVFFDAKKCTIAIQTDPIVLEGIQLGPFLVRLQWGRLAVCADVECFEIVALDPNPAENDESVTHPHVRGRHLCAGDATLPVQAALEQGRLIDAFCIVRSVLQTYNSSSAYVSLDDWGGISCWSCGSGMDEDDRCYCDRCDHNICCDCTANCKHCDRYYCSSCQDRCDVCNEYCCSACLELSPLSKRSLCDDCAKVCAGCEERVAPSDIDEASGLCPTCREAAEEEAPAPEEVSTSLPTN